jgi:hypothetical protein
VINSNKHPDGYVLLQCLRAYLNLNMYTGFNVHTMETIAAGENALEVFAELMKVYFTLFLHTFTNCYPIYQAYKTICVQCGNDTKDWNIPKMHTHTHTFPDIMAKGVTINYDTKPNEGTHGAPKDTYKLISNGKEYEDTVRRFHL